MRTWISVWLCAAALAACGPKGPAEPGGPVLSVGVEARYEPFETVNAQGDFEGFDIDLARELGRALGRRVEWKDMAWDSLIPELESGRIDMICSGMSFTAERAERIDFTEPYAQSPMSVLVSTERAKDVKTAAQLDDPGVEIAVQRGTTGEKKAREAFPKATFREFGNENDAASMVGTGRAHAFVYDYLSVAKYARQFGDKVRVLDETLGGEDYCIAVRKGSPLRAQLDAALAEAKKPGGAIEKLMDKWLPGAGAKLKAK